MLYYIFKYLNEVYSMPGAGVFEYLSFRAAMAVITSLIISLLFGNRWINYLNKKQVGETIRDLGLEGQLEKQGTPTMGGLIIIASIVIPALLFAKLDNIYIIMMLFTTVWLGGIGFLDDYIKVFKKKKEGLKGKYKIAGQVILGLIIGSVMFFSSDVRNLLFSKHLQEHREYVHNPPQPSGLFQSNEQSQNVPQHLSGYLGFLKHPP